MSAEEREAVLAEHKQRFGPYSVQRWQLEQRIRDLAEAEPAAEAPSGNQQGDEREIA